MTSETVNIKLTGQMSKVLNGKIPTEGSNNNKVNVKKKDNTVGLRVPGSNWEKFKTLVTDATQESTNNVQNKRKKNNRKFTPKSSEQEQNKRCATENEVGTVEKQESLLISRPYFQLTRVIAMDCEMVGIGDGYDSMIARVSIVNRSGFCVYDKYVKPTEEVQDYRTAVSGIQPHHLENGHEFQIVQKEVSDILKGRILVGHALHNDLSVLFLSHPNRLQRDTSRYKLFRKVTQGNTPSLKKLASELLGLNIQCGEHNSIEDARTAMQLYMLFRKKWENDIRNRR